MTLPILATSKYCGPCQILKPELESVSGFEYEMKDIVEDSKYFLEHGIVTVPCLVTTTGEKIYGANNILDYARGDD